MKKLFLIIILAAAGFSASCQIGTGWIDIRSKQNFRDTTNFEKGFKVSGIQVTLNAEEFNIWDGAVVSTAELNHLVGLRSNLQQQLDDTATLALAVNAQSASYTLALTDAYNLVTVNSASENTVTVPPSTSVAFETGAYVKVASIGEGSTSIAGGTGVTVNAPNDELGLVRYEVATLYKIATDSWLLEKTAVDTSATAPGGSSTLLEGLRAYWKLDETSGTTVYDAHTGGFDGTTNAVVNQTGMVGKAETFARASSQYVNLGSTVGDLGTSDFTLSAIIYMPTLPSDYSGIAGNWGDYPYFYMQVNDANYLQCIVNFAGSNITTYSNVALSAATWYHVVYVVDRSASTALYINGVAQTDSDDVSAHSAVNIANPNIFSIGQVGDIGLGYFFSGTIDEVMLSQKALSSAEVTELYQDYVNEISYPF